jgi:hypothetical protein
MTHEQVQPSRAVDRHHLRDGGDREHRLRLAVRVGDATMNSLDEFIMRLRFKWWLLVGPPRKYKHITDWLRTLSDEELRAIADGKHEQR